MASYRMILILVAVIIVITFFGGFKLGHEWESIKQRYHIFQNDEIDPFINEPDSEGNIQLHHEARFGCESTLKLLVEQGAYLNVRNKLSETPLHKAALKASESCGVIKNCLHPLKYLVEQGADVYAKDTNGFTFLHSLLQPGTTITPSQVGEIAEFLVGRNLTNLFNVRDNIGDSSFQLAVRYIGEDSRATLALLHENQVDFNNINKYGNCPLSYAVLWEGGRDLLASLIQFGANYTILNELGHNLLHNAANVANLPAVQFFIEKGLDVNAICREHGNTPLHLVLVNDVNIAKYSRVYDVAKYLVEKGASKKIKNREGETPYDVAKKNEVVSDKDKILELLKY